MPAKVETTAALPGLSPVGGKPVIARFDGGHLSSDGGLLVLREVERRLDVAGRLAGCIKDPRDPERVVHGLDEIIRFGSVANSSVARPDGCEAGRTGPCQTSRGGISRARSCCGPSVGIAATG